MSKRPTTTGAVVARLRRPFGGLRDTPIWAKLGLIMIVPTIATLVVGITGLVGNLETQSRAERARILANLSQVAGQLVHDLQNERAAAAMVLGTRDPGALSRNRAAYEKAQEAVDRARPPYTRQRSALARQTGNFRDVLNEIDANLAALDSLRNQVVNGKLTLTDAETDYQVLVTRLLSIRSSAAQLAGEPTLSDRMRAAAEISRIKDQLAERRVVVHQVFNQNSYTPKLRADFIATQTGQQQAENAFDTVATRRERGLYTQTVTGPGQREAAIYQGELSGKVDEDLRSLSFDAAKWDAAMREQADLVRSVEANLDAEMVRQATALRDRVQRQVLLEGSLLLGVLVLAIVFAVLVARSMARSLRELRQGALAVAQYGLPQAVARLREPAMTSQLSPTQVAKQIAEPLPVRSRDEFGQVTEAFNAVHLEAVKTAAEQAALRASVSTMFVNLARRSQILVDRLIGHLDRLERGEEDPDRLAELFQLDHLATRMRRNDENLLVLAGADSTRVQREPAALLDVLRAAQSEVEHYTRIEFGLVDRDIEIAAHAVNDLVHLIAELFDNATAFSPPDSHVLVEARRVGDRAVLYVEDKGIGISADQLADLNERLATPPMVDVTVSRMMGLVVVARLANRHGVRVELRPGAERGTIADVTLPESVLVPRAVAGRPAEAAERGAVVERGPAPRRDGDVPAGALPAGAAVPLPRPPAEGPLALQGPLAFAGRDEPTVVPGLPVRPNAPAAYSANGAGPQPAAPALNGSGPHGPAPRGIPAWSDLTGASLGPP
ncbi:MAG TPA: nitrate- and nitrite sensing domain-containing protein, partial [Pilimelia sp.]|nr:nitrate- and nitrite sensing domain-containing protein [Pilimelia sp.]